MVKKKLRLKKPIVNVCKIILLVIVVSIIFYFIYLFQVKSITKVGYSKDASKRILLSGKKKYVLQHDFSKTIDAAFRSIDYKEDNLDNYFKINYQKQKNIIKNINTLIDKGYSNSNISIILAHGDDQDVTEFAKKDKIKYLEEFYNFDYAKLKYYDRYVNYSKETGEDEETTVIHVNLGMDNDDYVNPVIVSSFSTDMLVNKHYKLSDDFIPTNLIEINSNYTDGEVQKGYKEAVYAFYDMADVMKKKDLNVVINSSYRTSIEQEQLYEEFLKLYGESYVKRCVAKGQFSEHQTGLLFGIGCTNNAKFSDSLEEKWLLDNAYKYGFVLRYPKNKDNITGFKSNFSQYRYVGIKVAKYIHDNNLSFEEYYVKFINK